MRSDISVYHGVRHSKLQIYTFFACHAIAARHAMLQKKIFAASSSNQGKWLNLQVQTEPQKPGPGSCVTGCTGIIESVYSTHRFLTIGNSRKILIGDKDEATVDARGYVIYVPDIIRCEGSDVRYCCIYKRGLLQVCRPTPIGNARSFRQMDVQQVQILTLLFVFARIRRNL